MLSKLLLGAGQKLTERVVAAVTLPALGFWFVGFVTLYLSPAYAPAAERIGKAGVPQLALWAAALLGAIVVSAGMVSWLTPEVSRLILGEWPNWLGPWRRWCVARKLSEHRRKSGEWQALAKKIALAGWDKLSSKEVRTYQELELALRYWPSDKRQTMPTRLGNLLRAAESRPTGKYGLEPAVVWPRLELVVSSRAARMLDGVQGEFQAATGAATWSVLLPLWLIAGLKWGASGASLILILGLIPASVLLFRVAYHRSVLSLERFCETFEAAFDLYRVDLYRAARFPLPATPAEELETGRLLTAYLLRGSQSPDFRFAPLADGRGEASRAGADDGPPAPPPPTAGERSAAKSEGEPAEDRGEDAQEDRQEDDSGPGEGDESESD